MDELVKRLRERAEAFDYDGWTETASDYEKAADAIEEIQKRVPKRPHGRLIDADALEDELGRFCDDNWVYNTVHHAPTVIEAEEVYGQYTDTAGNFHWYGTHSGEHTLKAEEGERWKVKCQMPETNW